MEDWEKEFVVYPLAYRMKKLGFDKPCFAYFCNDRRDFKLEFTNLKLAKNWNGIESELWKSPIYEDRKIEEVKESLDERNLLFLWTSAPTWQSAFKWFRKEHNLSSHVEEGDNPKNYYPVINNESHRYNTAMWFDTYEEAELACLIKLIEIVENI
jgi:hypothetical protein